jgi:two-component system CheB/CheR fusion protein
LKKVFILLRNRTGHDFSHYKKNTILRRVQRRMHVHKIEMAESYVRFLQQTPAEVEALFRDLLIGVTSFFRDPEAFDTLQREVISKLLSERAPGDCLRIWVPGCSTGEEAYSIAILLQERLEVLKRNFKIQIFATDIDSKAIEQARTGIYPASISSDISSERLARFFVAEPGGGSYRIQKSVRDMLIFSEQDVIRDPPFSKLHLISCRNLMIYMGVELQKKLIPLFHYALNPGGVLFLGTSETVGDFLDLFTALDRKAKCYLRTTCEQAHIHRMAMTSRFPPLGVADDSPARTPPMKISNVKEHQLRELVEKTLLQHYATACVLTDSQGEILYCHGRTGKYLELAHGDAGVNILKMAREGLQRDLTTALHRAVTGKDPVRYSHLKVKTNGDFTAINLTVRPILENRSKGTDSGLFLVILEEAPAPEMQKIPSVPAGGNMPENGESKQDAGVEAQNAWLRQELRAKEEYIQSSREELETSNEELKSANEEMQSVNEELQSTNEELETAKEEMQSVNEELATVNAELQTKVCDLSRANNDLTNLLSGTGIGTIFVDHQQHIMRFTPAATQVINLIPADVGRPVGHILSNLINYSALTEDLQKVTETLAPVQVEVQAKTGGWYLLRIRPYRTLDNRIEGAVIVFIDITELKQAQDELNRIKLGINVL